MSNKIPTKMKNKIKESTVYKVYYALRFKKREYNLSEEYKEAQRLIDGAKRMVDLGCGTNPHPKASVAVDKYIEPIHRQFGENKLIDVAEIEKRGIQFVEADFESLPFADKQFDVAYSHHVIEHLDNPARACCEMQRIALGGVIVCPSIFAEYVFGRKYHKWIITYRKNLLIFIEKDWSEPWFGEGPMIENGKTKALKDCNPFDILLNEGGWYHGIHRYKRLSKMIQKYWFGHYRNMENVFVWKDAFKYLIVHKDGHIETSKETEKVEIRDYL